jgi:Flp pilus assembly protein TadD
MLDRPKEAIDEGERARTWAESSGRALVETYPYAGVLENMAFAKMQIEDYAGALSDIATANAFREDELTRQNLALALIIAKRFADAQQILRKNRTTPRRTQHARRQGGPLRLFHLGAGAA